MGHVFAEIGLGNPRRPEQVAGKLLLDLESMRSQ